MSFRGNNDCKSHVCQESARKEEGHKLRPDINIHAYIVIGYFLAELEF